MRANATTTLLGRAALLVPYSAGHVELYHSWMESEELREATASERLTLEEEREMQRNWAEDDAKLTFIVCDATGPGRPFPVGDVNLFFRERSPPPSSDDDNGGGASSSSYLHETAEVEVMIADARARGKGLAKEAVLLCLWWAAAGSNLATPGLRLARVKIGRSNAASFALFRSLGFEKTGGSDFFEEDHLELELFVGEDGDGGENRDRKTTRSSQTLCPQLARVGEYAVVGEVERAEDAAS